MQHTTPGTNSGATMSADPSNTPETQLARNRGGQFIPSGPSLWYRASFVLAISCCVMGLGGCSQPVSAPTTGSSATSPDTRAAAKALPDNATATASANQSAAGSTSDTKTGGRSKRRPVQLGETKDGSQSAADADAEAAVESVMAALQPLQVLLGLWNGTSRKAELDQPEWIWDLQTNPDQPALIMSSPKGKYIREARLTFNPTTQKYLLTTTSADRERRQYQGSLIEPVVDEVDDEDRVQRRFRLQLTESTLAEATTADTAAGTDSDQAAGRGAAGGSREIWQLELALQNNDRYLLELNRRRGNSPFQRVDTINTLRQGTSFAMTRSEDYGEKKCIISQGLGTIAVSHQGKTYWVCCTGCKAAFEEDPEKWIAKFEAKEKARMNSGS